MIHEFNVLYCTVPFRLCFRVPQVCAADIHPAASIGKGILMASGCDIGELGSLYVPLLRVVKLFRKVRSLAKHSSRVIGFFKPFLAHAATEGRSSIVRARMRRSPTLSVPPFFVYTNTGAHP